MERTYYTKILNRPIQNLDGKKSETGKRPKENVYTKLRTSCQKIFRNNQNSHKSPRNFPLCEFDTGVFLTCNQIIKMCGKKNKDAGD